MIGFEASGQSGIGILGVEIGRCHEKDRDDRKDNSPG